MAILDVEGQSAQDIADFLKVSTQYVYQVQKSPLYQATVEDIRDRLYAERINRMSDLMDRLHGEAAASIDKIVELRDNGDGLVPHAVQLAAAGRVLDHIVPKKTEPQAADNRRVVIIGDEAARRMASVLAEAGITPTNLTATRPLEEFIEEAAVIEAAAGE